MKERKDALNHENQEKHLDELKRDEVREEILTGKTRDQLANSSHFIAMSAFAGLDHRSFSSASTEYIKNLAAKTKANAYADLSARTATATDTSQFA